MIDKHPSRYKRRRVPTDPTLLQLSFTLVKVQFGKERRRLAPLLSTFTPNLCKANLNSKSEGRVKCEDVLFLPRPLLFI